MKQLSDDQQKRYRRQLIMKEIGEDGQKRLLKSRVLVVGAGGLGSPVTLYLAAAGVGTIGIADHDVIDISNLQRQILHATDTIGTSKTESAKKRLTELNPEVYIETYPVRITAKNIARIISHYDLVINAVDNIETRYILNKACVLRSIPLIEGAINNFDGHVMTIIPGSSACYQCIFPDDTEGIKKEIGVIGTLPGIIGTLQATEAIKYFLAIGKLLHNRIIFFNALDLRFREINVARDPHCSVCSSKYYQRSRFLGLS